MRDAQQSLMATRMRTKDLAGAARATNAFMQNAYSVECWGRCHIRYRLSFPEGISMEASRKFLRERMPNTMLQMLLRASNAVGYSNLSG